MRLLASWLILPSLLLPAFVVQAAGGVQAAAVTSRAEEVDKILSSPQMQTQMKGAAGYLRTTRFAKNPDDLRDIDDYVRQMARSLLVTLVNDTPAQPQIFNNLYPGVMRGLPNPDNIYRYIPVSPDLAYEITGRLGTSDDVSFQVTDAGAFLAGRLNKILGTVATGKLQVAPDGTFTIRVGGDPVGDGNWLKLPSDAREVMIRDTLADWSGSPAFVEVRRMDGGRESPPRGPLPAQAGDYLMRTARQWVEIVEQYHYGKPANTLPPVHPTGSGGLIGQYNAGGNFDLKDDEALVLTLRQGNAKYLGVQIGSNWYIAFDYAAHTSSLSNAQAIASPDGSVTYVIALRDPGVANWLDPVGHHQGVVLVRWQNIPGVLTGADLGVELVKLSDLRKALPPGTPMLDAAGRQRQIEGRQRDIAERAKHYFH